ncbi:hypothetical protein C8J56DRAFT_896154 [Mycena floridula]|nr:hypothetical protein C8J56DRAFT_896154 [Mycena floridula]
MPALMPALALPCPAVKSPDFRAGQERAEAVILNARCPGLWTNRSRTVCLTTRIVLMVNLWMGKIISQGSGIGLDDALPSGALPYPVNALPCPARPNTNLDDRTRDASVGVGSIMALMDRGVGRKYPFRTWENIPLLQSDLVACRCLFIVEYPDLAGNLGPVMNGFEDQNKEHTDVTVGYDSNTHSTWGIGIPCIEARPLPGYECPRILIQILAYHLARSGSQDAGVGIQRQRTRQEESRLREQSQTARKTLGQDSEFSMNGVGPGSNCSSRWQRLRLRRSHSARRTQMTKTKTAAPAPIMIGNRLTLGLEEGDPKVGSAKEL